MRILIDKEHLLDQLDGRPDDGWISIKAVKAMIESATIPVTTEYLKEEAKKRGLRLYTYQPYVPLLRCTCGKKAMVFTSISNHKKYRCLCGKTTEWCRSDKEARREWNRMVGE